MSGSGLTRKSGWTQLPDARPDESLAFERIPMPARSIVPDDVRPLLAATELRESCKLNYQSMTTSESTERIVCPHSLVKASGRWHVRAFDFSRKRFIDFSLPRVLASAPFVEQPAVPSELDDDWHASVAIEFIPHPKLSLTQKSATAREFKMKDGQIVVTVRRALLFYLLDEMRLLSAVRSGGENMADGISVWVNNIEHVSSELARMEIDG
jgi:predicted DNA-binding transcriptional regulator YafY